jgi:hypothetical protein
MADVLLHIVYLRSGPMLLTKKSYGSWRDIQDEFEDYMASLGPWPAEDVLHFLRDEYPNDLSPAEIQRINGFLGSGTEMIEILGTDPDRQGGQESS